MADFTFSELKQFALNALVLNSVQIASIKAASAINLESASQGLKNLVSKILNNPEDTGWCKSISFYVVLKNSDLAWDKFQENTSTIEATLVSKCTEAIQSIGI